MPVTIELGMQTIHDKSLLFLNRNHNHQDTLNALEMCAEYNIPTGVHLIIGIPEETESMVLETINFVNKQRNIKDVKIHNLLIFQHTKLAEIYHDYHFLSYPEYLDLLSKVIGNLQTDKTVSRLFTSNLRQDSVAINSFPGIKQIWLKDLWLLLKRKNICQGSLVFNIL